MAIKSTQAQIAESFLRMAIGHIGEAERYVGNTDDPDPPDESSLLSALAAMDHAKWNIRQWAAKHGVVIREAMNT